MLNNIKSQVKCAVLLIIATLTVSGVAGQTIRGQSIRSHNITLTPKKKPGKPGSRINKIMVLAENRSQETGTQIRNILALLQSFPEFQPIFSTFAEIEKKPRSLKEVSLVWIDRQDSVFGKQYNLDEKMKKIVRDYLQNGGKLLVSNQAVHYLETLGIEPGHFRDSLKACNDEGFGRRLGFHAFKNHPLFEGLNGGSYILKPDSDRKTPITGFFGADKSNSAEVIAVDWDYIFLREDSKLIFEYNQKPGKIVAVGAYMDYTIPNRNSDHLQRFTVNCIHYLLGNKENGAIEYWSYNPSEVTQCRDLPQSDQLIKTVPASQKWSTHESELALKRNFGTDNFWDEAGERALIMGKEKSGIEEVWVHPFMAFRDYEVGIRFSYKDSIFWLKDERPAITVNPQDFTRLYQFSRAFLKEIVVAHPENPTGVVHYEYRGVYPADLIIRFTSNLRRMWPYSEKTTGTICHSWNYDYNAMWIANQAGDLNLMIGGTKSPSEHFSGQYEGFEYQNKSSGFKGISSKNIQAAGMMVYPVEMNDNLDIVFAASSEGYDSVLRYYKETVYNPGEVYRQALEHTRRTLDQNLTISSPDPVFNLGYRWALLATDRFFVNTPGMGKALVAGYSTTAKGWDGGHVVNGRPGYGWYFGRDAEWSSFALLDYGDFDKVKSQLEFFNRFQDLNGKIFHEASTSGLIHYDAADATPLYIVLAGKYFRHSGDTAFIRQTWPNIKRAINFCFSTDTDHDHLIENTNVGHGWVEGGNLYGSHSTIYMAGSWGAALREAAGMAGFMKDIEAESYLQESREQFRIIDERFWSSKDRFYAYGMDKNQKFRNVQTILPAVPVYFRMTDPMKSLACEREYASNAFSANWGVRILREDNPWFKPYGYHYGSVWPLFTGWASLAEYTSGNSAEGFSHLMNNLSVYKNWGLGFVEEVLNGAEYLPSGVCPHQCWSETMVLQPAIEGVLGLQVYANESRLILAPHLPFDWDSLSVKNIRVGERILDFRFKRENRNCTYQFTLKNGKPLKVDFYPSFAPATLISNVALNGKEIAASTFSMPQSQDLSTSFEITGQDNLTLESAGGTGVLPVVTDPRPGESSEGLRILSTKLQRDLYTVEFEGLSGASYNFDLWFDTDISLISDQCNESSKTNNKIRYEIVFQPGEKKYQTVTISWKIQNPYK